jgi:hypothetical protein
MESIGKALFSSSFDLFVFVCFVANFARTPLAKSFRQSNESVVYFCINSRWEKEPRAVVTRRNSFFPQNRRRPDRDTFTSFGIFENKPSRRAEAKPPVKLL